MIITTTDQFRARWDRRKDLSMQDLANLIGDLLNVIEAIGQKLEQKK